MYLHMLFLNMYMFLYLHIMLTRIIMFSTISSSLFFRPDTLLKIKNQDDIVYVSLFCLYRLECLIIGIEVHYVKLIGWSIIVFILLYLSMYICLLICSWSTFVYSLICLYSYLISYSFIYQFIKFIICKNLKKKKTISHYMQVTH